jgi:hypothetical protein
MLRLLGVQVIRIGLVRGGDETIGLGDARPPGGRDHRPRSSYREDGRLGK